MRITAAGEVAMPIAAAVAACSGSISKKPCSVK